MTCGGMLEVPGILFSAQDFRARMPEKGIAAMDGGAIPVRPASITLRRMPGTSCVPEPEHQDGPAA